MDYEISTEMGDGDESESKRARSNTLDTENTETNITVSTSPPSAGTRVPSSHHPITNRPVAKIGCEGSEPGQFKRPTHIAIDNTGMMYVSDMDNKRIQKLNSEGSYVTHWDTEGFIPAAIAVNLKHKELVCNKKNLNYWRTGDVVIYSLEGQIKKEFTISNMRCIAGVAVNSRGEIICSDIYSNSISIVSEDNTILRKFGARGKGPVHFHNPQGVCVGPDDNIIIADASNQDIQTFDRWGFSHRQFGHNTWGTNADYVAVDKYHQILVSDERKKDVQVFSSTGEFIRCIDSSDDRMLRPCDLAVTQDHHVLVVDKLLHCIFKFKYM